MARPVKPLRMLWAAVVIASVAAVAFELGHSFLGWLHQQSLAVILWAVTVWLALWFIIIWHDEVPRE